MTLREKTLALAAERPKAAKTEDGKCSLCGLEAEVHNFCNQCGATFLTTEQIERGKLNSEVGLHAEL